MVFMSLSLVEEIVKHAGDSLPGEACGILAGKDGKIEKVYKMKNTSDKPETCYFMDPEEQFKVLKEIRSLGLEMIGIYHSHPGSEAYPSPRDTELAFYPEAIYVIVSLKDRESPELKAYKIVEGEITKEEISI